MMHKRVLLLTVIAFFVCGSIAMAEDEMCVPMGDITLESPAQQPLRSEVTFPHSVHFKYACQQCHHNWDGKTPIVGCQTSGCHDLATKPDSKNKTVQIRYYKDAFHTMCIGCHKELKAQYQAKENSILGVSGKLTAPGPTSCSGCHPKE